MPHPSIQALLAELAWPEHALDRKGTLTWSAALRDAPSEGGTTLASASVLVSDTQLTLRCRSATVGGPMEPLLEAKWTFSGDSAPELASYTQMGQGQPLDEAKAIAFFQDRVNLLGVRPQFQAFAARATPSAPAPKP